jgi:hypothetical protein
VLLFTEGYWWVLLYKPSSFSSYLLNVLLQLANKKWDSKQTNKQTFIYVCVWYEPVYALVLPCVWVSTIIYDIGLCCSLYICICPTTALEVYIFFVWWKCLSAYVCMYVCIYIYTLKQTHADLLICTVCSSDLCIPYVNVMERCFMLFCSEGIYTYSKQAGK